MELPFAYRRDDGLYHTADDIWSQFCYTAPDHEVNCHTTSICIQVSAVMRKESNINTEQIYRTNNIIIP